MNSRTLSHEEARRVYDRIGARQDTQRFYEDRATDLVLLHGEFGAAESVFEFGCGTGRFAQRLIEGPLSPAAHYRGVDVSSEMVRLARARLTAHSPRAEVQRTDGGPPVDEPSASCDRFVSNYVFDLLSHEDIRAVLREAYRMLRPDGLLCVSGLTTGIGPVSRAAARAIAWVQAVRPALVGGCRPVDLLPFLSDVHWEVVHHTKVVAFAIASEIVVARRM